jgi:hypothetical protein
MSTKNATTVDTSTNKSVMTDVGRYIVSMALVIPIFTRKAPSDLDPLIYGAKILAGGQRRLNGRWLLQPDIDLSKFTCRAVVDWLEIHFSTVSPTRLQELRRLMASSFGGTKPWVTPVESPTARGMARFRTKSHLFVLRVQEPDFGQIAAALIAVDSKYHLDGAPRVPAIEVSIDFTPKVPCDRNRLAMVLVLGRHLRPTVSNVISRKPDRPRFSWGDGKIDTISFGAMKETINRDTLPLSLAGDQAPFADATLYLGAKCGPVMWRIMDKVVDRQNRGVGTARTLAAEERRARIEVVLRGAALNEVGIGDFSKLSTFRFEKLARFFRFSLPTFSEPVPPKPICPAAWISRRRWQKFEMTGIVGSDALDKAVANERDRTRLALMRAKLPIRQRERAGNGAQGTLVAYREMNKAVDTALRHLSESIAGKVTT